MNGSSSFQYFGVGPLECFLVAFRKLHNPDSTRTIILVNNDMEPPFHFSPTDVGIKSSS